MSAQPQLNHSGSIENQTLSVIETYAFPVGERTWRVPDVRIETDSTGEAVVPGAEVTRITRSVANAICGNPERLATAELEFLCDLNSVRYVEVAQLLDVNKATVSIWLKKGTPLSRTFSYTLKKWFWQKLFAKKLAMPLLFPVEEAFEDVAMLQRLQREAIQQGLASPLATPLSSEPAPR